MTGRPAERMRDYRRRRRSGCFVLRLEIDRDDLAECLFDNHFIDDWRETDNDVLADALRRLLEVSALSVAPLQVTAPVVTRNGPLVRVRVR